MNDWKIEYYELLKKSGHSNYSKALRIKKEKRKK